MNDKVRTRSTGLAGITNLAVLAPLHTGMVPGIEPISYVERLGKVLTALHAARQNRNESELWHVFPDVVGRFGLIHGFRYALVKPEAGPAGMPADFGTWRLSLNVTFDGAWEPYMRVIKRDIGPLLDLLFCHSPDYPGSGATFEAYCDWVRRYEVPAGLFFADSTRSVNDGRYLANAELLQRDGATDEVLARYRLDSMQQRQQDALAKAWLDPERALALPSRTLKGLYRLRTYFQPYADGPVLLKFAQHALEVPIRFMQQIEQKTREPGQDPKLVAVAAKWDTIKGKLLRDELEWLNWDKKDEPASKPEMAVDSAALQAHVLGVGEKMTHGCLVLLQVKDPQKALVHIAHLAKSCGPVPTGDIGYLVGFTYAGLEALGVTPDQLAHLPQELFEGMEARSALLGDLRTNHPDRWTRPKLLDNQSGQRVDFHAVHLLVQVRLQDKENIDPLHPRLEAAMQALGQIETGLRVLAVEPMRSYRDKHGHHAVGHMDHADGLSQPNLHAAASGSTHYSNDQVSAGELILGYANDRGDATPKLADRNLFLHNGTFLAVRKLRQFMDRLDEMKALPGAHGKTLLETMVGRSADGTPLHGKPGDAKHDNDFDFKSQVASDACPFHSHIRRTNPRDGRTYTPRILRRGMSWGLHSASDRTSERGVMFMAYCASISEQFEVIQRWVAGGNASGVGSAQVDPLLHVPKEGEEYTFRYLADGKVNREKMSDKPLVQLQWGLYAFVPSLAVLETLTDFTKPVATQLSHPPPGLSELEAARALLEDRSKSEAAWGWVRKGNSLAPQDGAYGHLVGTLAEVLTVLRDNGTKYSVAGYDERMEGSIGLNLLGMDPSHPRRIKELGVKDEIAKVREHEAFSATREFAQAFLKALPSLPSVDGDVVRRPVDLSDFSSWVLAQLCRLWFGVPDDANLSQGGYQPGPPGAPRCPGSLGPASRYMFMPHPHPDFAIDGRAHAKAVRDAVGQWLAGKPDLKAHRLSQGINAALAGTRSEEFLADNIAGTMLGFTPSVQSNFLRVVQTWLEEGSSFWVHQQSLFEHSPTTADLSYDEAKAALRKPLMAAIRKNPVPTMAFRSPVEDGKPDTSPGKRVALGLESALTDPDAPDVLVFGRDHHESGKDTTVHGCPGYEMAMGVLLALIGSLMKAGTLRPTGSPVLLILTPPERATTGGAARPRGPRAKPSPSA